MAWSPESYLDHSATCLLVAARVAALLLIAPLFGQLGGTVRVRAALALVITVLVVPSQWAVAAARPEPLSAYLVQLGAELLIGATLGLGLLLFVASAQVAGQLIGQMSGIQLSDVFDPGADGQPGGYARLLTCVSIAVFLSLGGHRRALEALLDTFAWVPAGQGSMSHSALAATTSLLAQSFSLGLRVAGPAIVALLLSTLLLGLVNRTLPQLNVLVMGLGLNALATTAVLAVSLAAAAWTFEDQLQTFLDTALAALKTPPR